MAQAAGMGYMRSLVERAIKLSPKESKVVTMRADHFDKVYRGPIFSTGRSDMSQRYENGNNEKDVVLFEPNAAKRGGSIARHHHNQLDSRNALKHYPHVSDNSYHVHPEIWEGIYMIEREHGQHRAQNGNERRRTREELNPGAVFVVHRRPLPPHSTLVRKRSPPTGQPPQRANKRKE
jgi:hypothetical protein